MSAEAEQQRLSAVDSTVNVVNIRQSERARESETMDASSRVVDEKDRRAAASALRKEKKRREDDPRVGGQWRIATLSRRGKCSPAAGT